MSSSWANPEQTSLNEPALNKPAQPNNVQQSGELDAQVERNAVGDPCGMRFQVMAIAAAFQFLGGRDGDGVG